MSKQSLLDRLPDMSATELRRVLAEHLTQQKLGLYWERDAIAHDRALHANVVLPRVVPQWSHTPDGCTAHQNLVIEGDNFDSLRLLKSTHAGRVRVIYIDPPYNTGNKDWVYNDRYVGVNDRWRHSQWLEFLYQRLALARDLLTPDGVILVSINEDNRSRLELLMDEVFPGRKLGSFVWKTRSGSNDEQALFSVDHEHVLVYGQPRFKFLGEAKDFAQYKNPDKDPRGPWKTGDLGQGKTYLERPNAYYPIQNPSNGVWYPCNPAVVWRFASEARIEDVSTLRAKTMEQYIREDKVIFPEETKERVVVWHSMAELLAAIESGDVPLRPKTKTPLLTADLPDLAFWVGKRVGFGRPWFKRHLRDVQSDVRPISSWVRGAVEDDGADEWALSLMAQRSGTGEHSVNEILGFNAFPYPKPLSLIKALLAQATRPDDTVLDFFAGSGTTGQAVLDLNAEDGGTRRFILCSSTETTDKTPDKNLCRDVCAERLRRVMQGYAGKPGVPLAQGGEFAYVQLDKFDSADVAHESNTVHAATLLQLRYAASAPAVVPIDVPIDVAGEMPDAVSEAVPDAVQQGESQIQCIARGADWLLVLCPRTDAQALNRLRELATQDGVSRLLVVCTRPKAVAQWLADHGVQAQTLSLLQVLTQGQEAPKPRRRSKTA